MQIFSKINSIERRVKKSTADSDSDIKSWIRAGLTYDQLTDEQQKRYDTYWGLDLRGAYECLGIPMCFELELRPKTEKEEQERFKMRVAADREIFDRFRDEYNAPEAVAQRQAEYNELQEIGKLRQQAFEHGEDMSIYPLPWEVRHNEKRA